MYETFLHLVHQTQFKSNFFEGSIFHFAGSKFNNNILSLHYFLGAQTINVLKAWYDGKYKNTQNAWF